MSEPLPTRALSIRQPWAGLIVNGAKDIENRSRRTLYRGPVLIHASLQSSLADWQGFAQLILKCPSLEAEARTTIGNPQDLKRGGIVGVADIVDCVDNSDSPWFVGPWGWRLANARPLPFKACRGMLGIFNCDYTKL